jgi:hypothetical protein
MVGSCLACKYSTMVVVTDSDKCPHILESGNNYNSKKHYSIFYWLQGMIRLPRKKDTGLVACALAYNSKGEMH